MYSNRYTVTFALVVCVVCSVLLALTAGALKPRIQRNEELDIRKNILRVLNLYDVEQPLQPDEMDTLYNNSIRLFYVDTEGKTIEPSTDSGASDKSPGAPGGLPVYARRDGGVDTGYAAPFSGKGLWGTIYGYLSVESDGDTVMGITFYKHNETPGLGGEIEQDWFAANFVGKKLFDADGRMVSITVHKGRIPAGSPESLRLHTVDGISGATQTGRYLTVLLDENLRHYEPFFKTLHPDNETSMIPGDDDEYAR